MDRAPQASEPCMSSGIGGMHAALETDAGRSCMEATGMEHPDTYDPDATPRHCTEPTQHDKAIALKQDELQVAPIPQQPAIDPQHVLMHSYNCIKEELDDEPQHTPQHIQSSDPQGRLRNPHRAPEQGAEPAPNGQPLQYLDPRSWRLGAENQRLPRLKPWQVQATTYKPPWDGSRITRESERTADPYGPINHGRSDDESDSSDVDFWTIYRRRLRYLPRSDPCSLAHSWARRV